MGFFVRSEFGQRRFQFSVSPPASNALTAINIDRSVLPDVVDLEDTVAESLTVAEPCGKFHIA